MELNVLFLFRGHRDLTLGRASKSMYSETSTLRMGEPSSSAKTSSPSVSPNQKVNGGGSRGRQRRHSGSAPEVSTSMAAASGLEDQMSRLAVGDEGNQRQRSLSDSRTNKNRREGLTFTTSVEKILSFFVLFKVQIHQRHHQGVSDPRHLLHHQTRTQRSPFPMDFLPLPRFIWVLAFQRLEFNSQTMVS